LDGENIEYISVPHQIDPDPWNGNIVKIYASSNYSAALSKDGKVFFKLNLRRIHGVLVNLADLDIILKRSNKRLLDY
jgi:hypothetical protein